MLVQQAIDGGFVEDQVDIGFVTNAAIAAIILVLVIYVLGVLTFRRVIVTAENTLLGLRVRTFQHIQRLSIAEHTSQRKGVLTARVTSDVETLAQFSQWGALNWIVSVALIIGTVVVMAVYSWQLTLVTLAIYLPLLPILRNIQRRQLRAYNIVRSATGEMIGRTSEAISGASTIRAYGYENRVGDRLEEGNRNLVASEVDAHKFFSLLGPTMDFFGGLTTGAVVLVSIWLGADTLTVGEATGFIFLATLLTQPITQLAEVLDQTQTALAGWWKIMQMLDIDIDVVEADPGQDLPTGAPDVALENVEFSYRTGGVVLDDISLEIASGQSVAVVGETGSGKSTMALLLARLYDPTKGVVRIAGLDLSTVDRQSRNLSLIHI